LRFLGLEGTCRDMNCSTLDPSHDFTIGCRVVESQRVVFV
jgi:hypothetical protein